MQTSQRIANCIKDLWKTDYNQKEPPEMFCKKKVFLDFHKIHRKTPLLLQRDSDTGVFLWILQNFKEILFYRTIQGDCLYIINFHKQRPEVFYEKDVLRNFTKFTGKHLCQSLFFNWVTWVCNFLLLHQVSFKCCLSVAWYL